ncbi:hypothetical protein [Hominisplanchenecus murintestinalis]
MYLSGKSWTYGEKRDS